MNKYTMPVSKMWPTNAWSLRHLNWSLVLYSWLVAIPFYLFAFVWALWAEGSAAESATAETIILGALVICAVACSLYLPIWYLRHKGRSLWNLLYLLIPYISGIIFLCLDNKTGARDEQQRS